MIRTIAFVRRATVATLRQPRLLLTLVLGPFLVLFVFGLGYERELPTLAALVVGEEDSELYQRIDEYVSDAEVQGIEFVGTRTDRDAALEELKGDDVDLVVVLPDEVDPASGQRAGIEVHQRTPDPVTTAQVDVAATTAVHEINDQVVAEMIATLREETSGLSDELAVARDQVQRLRDTVGDQEAGTVQAGAANLAEQLQVVADRLEQASPLVEALGLGDAAAVAEDLRSAADRLGDLAEADPVAELEELAGMLERADESLAQLREADPEVLARPFDVEVFSFTPQRITLDRFYAPGLLALMLQHVAITFAALGLVRERRQGMTDVLRVSPVGTGERLVGTTIAHVTLGLVVAAGLTALIIGVFGVPVPTSWGAFVALVLLTLVASTGYGLVIAALARTDSQAVQLSMLMLLTAIFFSGLFLPLARITAPVVWVSWALPTTYAFVGLQELMLLGDPAVSGTIWLGLSVVTVVLLAAAGILVPWRDRHA